MSNEVILKKTLFGGFKKGDVLDYIEKLQQENVELKAGAGEKENILASLEEAYNTCSALKEEKAALEKAKEELLAKADELAAANEQLREALTKAENFRDYAPSEEKGKAVIRDAVKYADSLVDAAKQDAADVLVAAKARIDSAAESILQAQERANTARNNLDYSLSSVGESIKAMLDSLAGLTDELSGDNPNG